MRYYPLDMDSEAKVSGLAKKKEKISWVLPAFGIDDAAHKSTGTAGWVCNEGVRISSLCSTSCSAYARAFSPWGLRGPPHPRPPYLAPIPALISSERDPSLDLNPNNGLWMHREFLS